MRKFRRIKDFYTKGMNLKSLLGSLYFSNNAGIGKYPNPTLMEQDRLYNYHLRRPTIRQRLIVTDRDILNHFNGCESFRRISDLKKGDIVAGKFKVKSITKIEDLVLDPSLELGESDLCIQNDTHIIQFEYVSESKEKYIVEPGVFTLHEGDNGTELKSIQLKERRLLETINNTDAIFREARTFFSKLEIYKQLERPAKRGVLLFSKPGLGKSSAIEKFCSNLIKEDPGTVVMIWPTSQIDAETVQSFFSTEMMYSDKCTKLVLILEDIGGMELEEYSGSRVSNSGLLNFLDGVGVTFTLPTFIIATTNHPENLLESLADRPGRFDLMMEFKSPNKAEKTQLLEFIAKREITPEEKECLDIKGTENFSIAHLEEIVVRSLLHDKTFKEVVNEMVNHKSKFKKGFEETKGIGFNC